MHQDTSANLYLYERAESVTTTITVKAGARVTGQWLKFARDVGWEDREGDLLKTTILETIRFLGRQG